jgi:hypothetical protein
MRSFEKYIPIIGICLLSFIIGGVTTHYRWGPGKAIVSVFDHKKKPGVQKGASAKHGKKQKSKGKPKAKQNK